MGSGFCARRRVKISRTVAASAYLRRAAFLAEYVVYNADEPGRIRIACADALGLKGDGTLLTVRFTALSAAGRPAPPPTRLAREVYECAIL